MRKRRRTRGSRRPAPATQAQQVALALAPGPLGLAAFVTARPAGGGAPSLVASTAAGLSGNGGRVPSVSSWWISRPRAVPSSALEPPLLAEDVLGLRPGQHVVLDLVDARRELVERARLREHGGRDGAGRGRGDDLGRDLLDADEVLEDADLEGPLGPAAGEDERGGTGAGGRGHRMILAPRAGRAQWGHPPAAALTTSTREPGRAEGRRPLRTRDHAAVDGDRHALGVLVPR